MEMKRYPSLPRSPEMRLHFLREFSVKHKTPVFVFFFVFFAGCGYLSAEDTVGAP